jgi:hypothetical protein
MVGLSAAAAFRPLTQEYASRSTRTHKSHPPVRAAVRSSDHASTRATRSPLLPPRPPPNDSYVMMRMFRLSSSDWGERTRPRFERIRLADVCASELRFIEPAGRYARCGAVFERFHLVINLCRRYERVLMAVNDPTAMPRKHFSRLLAGSGLRWRERGHLLFASLAA